MHVSYLLICLAPSKLTAAETEEDAIKRTRLTARTTVKIKGLWTTTTAAKKKKRSTNHCHLTRTNPSLRLLLYSMLFSIGFSRSILPHKNAPARFSSMSFSRQDLQLLFVEPLHRYLLVLDIALKLLPFGSKLNELLLLGNGAARIDDVLLLRTSQFV